MTKYCFSCQVVSLLKTNFCLNITGNLQSNFFSFISPTAVRNKNAWFRVMMYMEILGENIYRNVWESVKKIFRREVITVTDLYNSWSHGKPNCCVPKKVKSTRSYYIQLLETKGINDNVRQNEFISLTSICLERAARLQFSLFPQTTSTPRKKLTRQTKRICKEKLRLKHKSVLMNYAENQKAPCVSSWMNMPIPSWRLPLSVAKRVCAKLNVCHLFIHSHEHQVIFTRNVLHEHLIWKRGKQQLGSGSEDCIWCRRLVSCTLWGTKWRAS